MAAAFITGQGVNLRGSPGGDVTGSLVKGEAVETLETSGVWTHVELTRDGHIVDGWASSQFVNEAPPAEETHALADPAGFFQALQAQSLPLAAKQQTGCTAILTACQGLPLAWTAYVLGTAALETGATFATDAVENLNYSADALHALYPNRISIADSQRVGRTAAHDPDRAGIANIIYGGAWGRANLGNDQAGDGFTFRGRGWVQITGRRNYSRADNALSQGGKLIANPDLMAQPEICAGSAVNGMIQGWFTTKKFADYLPDHGPASLDQFTRARQIINGHNRDSEIAGFAMKFQSALTAGGLA